MNLSLCADLITAGLSYLNSLLIIFLISSQFSLSEEEKLVSEFAVPHVPSSFLTMIAIAIFFVTIAFETGDERWWLDETGAPVNEAPCVEENAAFFRRDFRLFILGGINNSGMNMLGCGEVKVVVKDFLFFFRRIFLILTY